MERIELTTAVDSIVTENTSKSIFDPIDVPSTSSLPLLNSSSPLQNESSDEETRKFILKNDSFVPTPSVICKTPRVSLRKTPRIRNAPTCSYIFKRGPKKNETCGVFCKLGDEYCTKHKIVDKKTPSCNFESIAIKKKFARLKVSKKYRLLTSTKETAILENDGCIIKVRLPRNLMPMPKTGSLLKFVSVPDSGNRKAVWEVNNKT